MATPKTFTVFHSGVRVAAGTLGAVAQSLRERGLKLNRVMLFDDATGDLMRLNTDADLAATEAATPDPASAALPVALELRIPARDRDWLERQSGGASAAIRRLVAAARRDRATVDREAKDAAYRFIAMLAGDFVGYEEACRALFAGELERFEAVAAEWPADIRAHARQLGWRTQV
jgi:uncharacterized protein